MMATEQDGAGGPAPGEDAETANQLGEEPGEESGAGYGNHATPGPADEPSEPDKEAR